jgi:uncharacterized protein (DUF362 family)
LKDKKINQIERRSFLAGAVSAAALGGCAAKTALSLNAALPEATLDQKKARKVGRSSIGIIQASSYQEDLFALIKPHIAALSLPNLTGLHVVIKPNMVEFEPDHPITTHPEVIKATAQLVDYLGASKITIAEGPGHMRDTEFLLAATGIGAICAELDLPFIDLNLDDLEKKEIEHSFSTLSHFYLPKTILEADAIISVPKMETHHWVGITASMKNLFGVVPGRKYGYPKNLLHIKGIPQCIIDINRLIRPSFALVDGIVAMEGDGPINGTAKDTKLLVIGTDVAAVDACCAQIMKFTPEEVPYLKLAGEVIGNIAPAEIDIVGSSILSVCQEFSRPITFSKSNPHAWEQFSQADRQGS